MNNAIKNLIPFIVIALTLICPHSLYAQTFTYTYLGNSVNYTIIDREAKTCKTKEGYKIPNYIYEPGNNVSFNAIVTIPETVEYENEKYTVVEIGYASFCQNSLKKIYLPKTVKNIGELAFAGCRGMSCIGLPDSLETIQDFAFSGCNELVDAVLPFNVSYIGKCAFEACGIKSLVIPPKIKRIEEWSFEGCRKLEEIVFPDSLTYIGQYAFDDCRSLSSVYIPNSVYTIANYAFNDCLAITSLTLGSSVGYIGEKNFNSPKLTKIVSLASIPPTLYKNECFWGVGS